jgi:Cu/Ag efflux protein CusF
MRTRSILAAGTALALLAGCATPTPPAPLRLETAKQAEATVVAIQAHKRLVSLRGTDGQTFTVEAGPSVRNFDRIKVGDKVIATYMEAIGFELQSPDVAAAPSEAGLVAGRAAPGEQPGAVAARFARTTVVIESIDPKTHTVTFKGEDGLTRAVPVMTSEGRAFASRLRRGDRVDVTWEEAVAISVEPGK